MKQRSEEERVQELQAKIAAIQARGERKRARANPAVRQAMVAVKAINRAADATDNADARKALGAAGEVLSAWLALEGLTVAMHAPKPKSEVVPEKRHRKRRNNTAVSIASA